MNTQQYPTKIRVTREFTYDVGDVIRTMAESNTVKRELTVKDIVEFIMDWVFDDFGMIVRDIDELTFTDENGTVLR